MQNKFKGIMPAAASPCNENDKFVPEKYAELLTWLYDQGVHGQYVCGTTGEGFKMLIEERMQAAETAVEVSRQRKGTVIVHVGCLQKRNSVKLAEHAAKIGADAVSSIPPSFCNQSQLVSFYSDIGRASGLPVIVYHIPMLTGRNPSLDELLELLDIPGEVGLKFTEWNLFLMKQLLMARPDTVIFSGFDEFLCPGLLFGASGGIGTWYNIFPRIFLGIYDSVQQGDITRAMKFQNVLHGFCDLAWKSGVPFGALEYVMRQRGYSQIFRTPRPTWGSETVEQLGAKVDRKVAEIEEFVQ